MEGTATLARPITMEARGLPEPEEELLVACRQGDREAFARLVEGTRSWVYGVALHTTGDPAVAADATQEAYLRALLHIHQFQGRGGFRTWLVRIAVNAARDQQRRGRRLVSLAGADEWAALEPSPEEQLLASEQAAELRRRLASLSPRLRLPLVLRFVAGLSYQEIGAALGLRPGTVASRLSRGLARLGRAVEGTVMEPRR